jgi:hypothetical protein
MAEPLLDDDGNPLMDDNGNPAVHPEQGMMSKVWDWANKPMLEAPSRWGAELENYLTDPNQQIMHSTGQGGLHDYLAERLQMGRGFLAGGLHGVGNVISDLSSPINASALALSGGSSLAESAGYGAAARGLSLAEKIPAALQVGHGGSEMLRSDATMGERGQGLMEAALGGAGLMHVSPKAGAVEKPILGGAEVQNARVNPKTGEMIIPGKTGAIAGGLEPEVPKVSEAPKAGGSLPIGTKIIVSGDKTTITGKLKTAREAGFDFDEVLPDGRFRMIKTKDIGPTMPITEEEVGHGKIPKPPKDDKLGVYGEANALTRTLMATWDLSAPFRQGIGMVTKPEFWKAIPTMVKSFGSEAVYQAAMKDIVENPRTKPLFAPRVGVGGKVMPSFAESVGVKLTDIGGKLTQREESMMSGMAEKYIPGVRAANRSYTIFLNKLRADVFTSLIENSKKGYGIDATKNLPVARALAEFVNVATGRGSLGVAENHAVLLSKFMFSPRLMASRLQMANPANYIMGPKQVRIEYLRSLLGIAAVGNIMGQASKLMGGEVESNPGSSDYGKIKLGDTRIDPYGGFQQYLVAVKRLLPHIDALKDTPPEPTDTGIVPLDNLMGYIGRPNAMMKSTTTGQEYDLMNPKFGQSNQLDTFLRFTMGKLAPIPNFALGLWRGQREMSGKPMNFSTLNPMDNSIAQRFIPMVAQDMYDLLRNENTPIGAKLAAMPLATLGMGVQTYGLEDFARPSHQMGE